jgi:hypothetical protein
MSLGDGFRDSKAAKVHLVGSLAREGCVRDDGVMPKLDPMKTS